METPFEKIMTENFMNLETRKTTQIQEPQRVPVKMNLKRPTPRHIIIKMLMFKDKGRILKETKENQKVTYKGPQIRPAADFSTKHCKPEGSGKKYSKL